MKKLLFQSGVLLLLLALMSTGHAQKQRYIPVFCGVGHSLQDALDRATEGATLDVYGTCNEGVFIHTDGVRVGAFFGQTTIINSPASSVAITVQADGVLIFNLNIMGQDVLTGQGVAIVGASRASVENNHISGGAIGVNIAQGSSVRVINNDILNSTSVGIFISQGSYGEIRDNTLDSSSGNFSQIFAVGSSSADVFNNTITASSGTGISAVSASSIEAGGNNVSGTAGFGMSVARNAHMFLPSFSPNTVNNPVGGAISCGFSGGLRVDVVQNTTGAVSLDPGCDVTDFFGLFP